MSFTIKNKLTIQNALSKSRDVVQAISDPFFKYVTALIKGTSVNNGTNNTFLDSSPNNFTLTRTGTPTQGTFTPYLENYSVQFNGSTDCVNVPSNSALTLGSGDFTIEFWVNTTTTSYTFGAHVVGTYNGTSNANGWTVSINRSTGGTYGVMVAYNNAIIATTNGYLPISTWNHVAVVRGSGTLKIYVNGVQGASVSNSYNDTNLGVCYIGSEAGASGTSLIGYVSNVRFVKGTALYNGNFAVPTTKLSSVSGTSLLTCQDNRFVDRSSNGFTLTSTGTPKISAFSPFAPTQSYTPSVHGGSGYFNGSTDYLSSSQNTAFAFGSSDFTIECWFNTNSVSSVQVIFDTRVGGADANGYAFSLVGTSFYFYNAVTPVVQAGTISPNTWYHVAFVRSGTAHIVYLNGVSIGTGTRTVNATSGNCVIGRTNESSTNFFGGYISNLRVVKGTAVYTSNFTPSTSPLIAISGTSLLTKFVNGSILDEKSISDIKTTNVVTNSSVVKYGSTSIDYGTSNGYTIIPHNNVFNFVGDFTIEGWLYLTSNPSSTYQSILQKRSTNSAPSSLPQIYIDGVTRKLACGLSSNGSTWALTLLSSSVVSTGVWIHFAVSRSGNNVMLFINGNMDSSGTFSGSVFSNTSDVIIGANGTTSLGEPLKGYLDDLRITNGIARYTSNFSVPTDKFPTQ